MARSASRLALAALALAACSYAGNLDPPAPADLADRFELVAFYNELTGEEIALHRWDDDIRVLMATPGSQLFFNDIRTMVDTLDRLLPQSVRLVGSEDEANLLLLIGGSQTLRQRLIQLGASPAVIANLLKAICGGVVLTDGPVAPNIITTAIVTINLGYSDEQIRRCIAQEMTQALGLPNDMADPDGTVFSSRSRRATLSESDEKIVRILYDRRLSPGMTRAEAMAIVRLIAAELEPQQTAWR